MGTTHLWHEETLSKWTYVKVHHSTELSLLIHMHGLVCLRIWVDNLILNVAAGGDVVWSSFSAGIFYHMERLENK